MNNMENNIEAVSDLLRNHEIIFEIKNPDIGHFHCWAKNGCQLIQFWAGTGKILGRQERGVHNLLKILEEE